MLKQQIRHQQGYEHVKQLRDQKGVEWPLPFFGEKIRKLRF
jgi:hypothetical protein